MQIMYLKVDSDLKYINYTLDSKKKASSAISSLSLLPIFLFHYQSSYTNGKQAHAERGIRELK